MLNSKLETRNLLQNNDIMPIPDQYHRRLQKLIERAQPQSMEEMQALLDSMIGKTLDELSDLASETPENQAFDLIDEAWNSSSARGKKLAAQALELWPDCLPAYEYLTAQSKSSAKRLEYLEKAVAIGKRLFGGEYLKQNRGYFWGLTETRPYMRCLAALAMAKAEAGQQSEAIVIWEDMLSLNPNDNQGIRYLLLPALLHEGNTERYFHYRQMFEEESSAAMSFNDALAHFIAEGDCPAAGRALKAGQRQNAYIAAALLATVPPTGLPPSYILGSPEEAVNYAGNGWRIWHETPGALAWLQSQQPKPGPKKAAPPLPKLHKNTITILFQDPLGPLSPLRLNENLKTEELPELPFLKLAVALLDVIHEAQALTLTQKGNLQRKTIHQLYDLRCYPYDFVDDGSMKLWKETDFFPLHLARVLCELAKLVNKRKNKLSLSKQGQALRQNPAQLYLKLLKTYILQYNWAYPEAWGYGVEQTGREGWALIFYELMRHGEQEISDEYYGKLYTALFPSLLDLYPYSEYNPTENMLLSDFERRFIHWFGGFFGLIEITREVIGKYNLPEERFVKRTAFAARVFELKL
jgi:hypothetical protein